MPWFHQTIAAADCLPENLKENKVGKIIEEEGQVRKQQHNYYIHTTAGAIQPWGEVTLSPGGEVRLV